jgi:hypothetical protein
MYNKPISIESAKGGKSMKFVEPEQRLPLLPSRMGLRALIPE